MGRNLEITDKLQTYIDNFNQSLHPVQQEIISYNNTLAVKLVDTKDLKNYG